MLTYLKRTEDYIRKHENGSKLYVCTCHFANVITAAKASAVFHLFESDSDRRAHDPTYHVGCKWFRDDVERVNKQDNIHKRKSIEQCEERCEERCTDRLKEKYQHQNPVELGKIIQDYQNRFAMIMFS